MIQKYNPHTIEPEILKFWHGRKIYKKAKEKNKGKKSYYFLDGPPYTSGRIHLGIAWNKSLKDCVLRYKRMCGFDVWDRAGYDMHGLPTAHKVQEKFSIKNKEEIPKFGVSKFIEECKKLSIENMNLMTKDFERLGVWMDFKNAYQPITKEFIEGVWWLVKKADENKRLYEGEKVMHWCSHCATALAKHELEYENDTDTSVFLKFKIKDTKNEYLVIWTTTPWTIEYNLGVMVNPDLDYNKIKVNNEIWYIAKALVGVFMGGIVNKPYKVLDEFKGIKLEGIEYEHPLADEIKQFAELKKNHPKVHTVLLSSEYVDTKAGTGLVHMAPGCGPEDYEVGHRNNILPFNNLKEDGSFPEDMGKFSGFIAKVDDYKFITEFEERGCLIAKTDVEHEYAHCWRCHKPVIFKTTKQWFFKVEDLKDELIRLNKKVYWVPDWAGHRQFVSWLENLRDNSITRQRYWGTPVPIWKCECGKYKVIESVKDIENNHGKVPKDIHRPYIDEVTLPCKCGKDMKRIPDILDVWIDAGTNSWTCLDYPTDKKLFKKLYPPEFILEGKDQIRGWFNLLLVASMVSMKNHPYKAVYMHGFVQDALGRKMSKSLGNIISPSEVIDKYGSDTLRHYMIGGTNPGEDINYNMEDMKVKNKNLTVLWNIHNYLVDFAKTIGVNPSKLNILKQEFSIEENYILSKLHFTINKVTQLFDKYKLNEIPWLIEDLFLELSRTYIQLTRDKVSAGTEEEKKIVTHTIYTVLINMLKLFAPIAPFISEAMYLSLKEKFKLKEESVFLCEWPKHNPKLINKELEHNMQIIKNVIQSALSAREKLQLGVRWPLKEIIILSKDKKTLKSIERLEDIIKIQTNVKEIRIQESLPEVKTNIKADFKTLGHVFHNKTPKIIAKLSAESPDAILKHLEKENKFTTEIDGEKLDILKEHLIITRDVPKHLEEAEFKNGLLYLNKERTDELEAEGYAREVMRRIQSLRKKAGLEKKDSIALFIKTDEDSVEMLKNFEKQIKEKVGSAKIKISELNPSKKHKIHSKEKIKGLGFEIFFDKV